MRDEISRITPSLLMEAYAAGVFPMAETADSPDIFWIDPRFRGILPLDGLRISKRLARSFLKADFEVRVDHDFRATVAACADRPETWINPAIADLYAALHEMGHAHSVEIWRGGELAGGLYGVRLGAAFFGESMFSRARDGSKFALVALVARLRAGGFTLLDTQFVTDHLIRLGAVEITRASYHRLLGAAIAGKADFRALAADASHQTLLQLSTQTS